MKLNEISNHYKKLNSNQKRRFEFFLNMLMEQCEKAMVLRGPYRFILDSNIIIRFENMSNSNNFEGLLAIMAFFIFYRKQSVFKADLLITPPVFYEFFRLKNMKTLVEFWENFKSIRFMIEDTLNIDVLFKNLDSFEKTNSFIKLIEDDANKIKKELIEINKKEWNYDFIRKPGGVVGFARRDEFMIEVPPLSAAEHLYEELDTQYYHPYYVGLFLKDHIAYKLVNNPNNNQEIINKYLDDHKYNLREVLFIDKRNRLKGLADIEVLTYCNLTSQFDQQPHSSYFPASIPLTLDTNLFISLVRYSQCSIASPKIIGGVDDKASFKAKLESSFDDIKRRMTRADNKQRQLVKASADFLGEVSELFDN